MLKGISGDGGSVEVDAVGSGLASARGSACSKERRVAELLDTAARRGVDGGRGYGEGVAAMASAMAGACEGEELERRGGVWEVREREGERSTTSPGEWSGKAASRCVARASSSLERRWAGPAGGPGAGRQVSFSIFSCFLFF